MTAARLVAYRRLARVAEAAGFAWVRRDGNHNTFQHADGRIVVIPDHGSRPIGRGLRHKILRQMDLSVEEYHRLLNRSCLWRCPSINAIAMLSSPAASAAGRSPVAP